MINVSFVGVKGMVMSPTLINGEPLVGHFICIAPSPLGFDTKQEAEEALNMLKMKPQTANE